MRLDPSSAWILRLAWRTVWPGCGRRDRASASVDILPVDSAPTGLHAQLLCPSHDAVSLGPPALARPEFRPLRGPIEESWLCHPSSELTHVISLGQRAQSNAFHHSALKFPSCFATTSASSES